MFTSLVSAVVLAGSITMPTVVDNPWSMNDWAPLKAEYQVCAETAHSAFSYYVCTSIAYNTATAGTVKA